MTNRPPSLPSPFGTPYNRRGLTLIELMIVVAIIGILGAIGMVSYTSYIQEGHLTELRQFTMDIERGQEQFFSRHHEYFEPDPNVYDPDDDMEEWIQLLEFDHDIGDHITVEVEADNDGNACGDVCEDGPDPNDDSDIWWAVRAMSSELDSYIFYSSELRQPMEIIID